MSNWKFITNHGAVLILAHQYEKITAREIADHIGITERSVVRILGDLEDGGYIQRIREGRRNTYRVTQTLRLRHDIGRDVAVGDFLNLFANI